VTTESIRLTAGMLAADGYCTVSGTTQRIFGAMPDEVVDCVPIGRKARKNYYRAETIIEPHPHRVEPRCPAAGRCGGCALQHVSPAAQVDFKLTRLQSIFADLEPQAWLPPLVSEAYHYRGKARLGVKFVDKKGRVLVGFREKLKPYIAETDACHVLHDSVSHRLPLLADLVGSLDAARTIPQIEIAAGDDTTALVFRHLDVLSAGDETKLLTFAERHGFHLYLQPGAPDTVHRIWPETGEPRLFYTVQENRFAFHPLDFTQVNAGVNRDMVALALRLLDAGASDRVLDAFCGIGNFSLAIARGAGHVVGLELSEASVARARENAALNRLDNVRFEARDLFADDGPAIAPHEFDLALIDPPRIGAERLSHQLASAGVKRVVYVSCNPETLYRDARILADAGFTLAQLGLIDMFPHTTHMESIAMLERSDHG